MAYGDVNLSFDGVSAIVRGASAWVVVCSRVLATAEPTTDLIAASGVIGCTTVAGDGAGKNAFTLAKGCEKTNSSHSHGENKLEHLAEKVLYVDFLRCALSTAPRNIVRGGKDKSLLIEKE